MQFIDSDHVLIKLISPESLQGKVPEHSAHYTAFFVVYGILTTEVLAIYENSSPELLQYYLNYDDLLGVSDHSDQISLAHGPSNCQFEREYIQKQMYAVIKAKNGGEAQAIRRILSALPSNAQSVSSSPYYGTLVLTQT
jgi:de-etiolated-1